VQEMVYLKAIQEITPMDVSVSGTIDQKTYLMKFRGGVIPLSPLDPPMIFTASSMITQLQKLWIFCYIGYLLIIDQFFLDRYTTTHPV